MTKIQKYFYNELPIGEWVKRNDYQYKDGESRCNWQLSFSYFADHKLVDIEFRGKDQYIRRKPTSEL